jgi:hypothetical protein
MQRGSGRGNGARVLGKDGLITGFVIRIIGVFYIRR